MNGEQRRQELINLLRRSAEPVPGNQLAQYFSVSRQVIVQDIALLKAADFKILSTCKGYVLYETSDKRRVFKVRHNDEQIADELYTIVDAGGRVQDVFVNHDIYGELRANLFIASRKDVDDFVKQLTTGKISPLNYLTNGYHYHTVDADSEEVLDCIAEKLKIKGYLNVRV